jgi:thiol-disulfide isomerase/thioredoxin
VEHWRSLVLVLALVCIVAVTAYAVSTQDPDDGDDDDDDGNGGNNPLPVEKAPTFTLDEVDGDTFSLQQFQGRVVVLDLFATWCGPCETQMGELNKLRAAYSASEVVIISIDVDQRETTQDVREFRDKFHADWTFARDTDGVGGKYNAKNIPTLALIDKDGNLVWRHAGVTGFEELSARIDPLL